jgi:hypothetical protein
MEVTVTPDAHPADGSALAGAAEHHLTAGPAASRPPPRPADPDPFQPIVIDCDSCSMRGLGCGDCMVTVLLGGPPYGVALDDAERRAIDALAEAGLIPPLRMVHAVEPIAMVQADET